MFNALYMKVFIISLLDAHHIRTIGGIEYGGCREDKMKEIVSHQLGVSMGYGDAHQ